MITNMRARGEGEASAAGEVTVTAGPLIAHRGDRARESAIANRIDDELARIEAVAFGGIAGLWQRCDLGATVRLQFRHHFSPEELGVSGRPQRRLTRVRL